MTEQLAGQIRLLRRIGDVVGQCRACQIGRSLGSQDLRVEILDGAGGEAQADHQSAPLDRIERGIEGALAHAVDDHIHADPIGQFAHALGHILMAVIDGVIAAMGAGDGGLFFGGNGANDR
ncbi:hypothetical protein D9M70_559410 [compost metagenome]